ncbi:MAG: LuxR C-terminal-related transcriptional regulator [Chloroflexota bacterium]|nr:LuxR C-terminal-related transcriptional regulator [Chloroflexota bacterium]
MIDTLARSDEHTRPVGVLDALTVVVVAAYPSLRAGLAALLADEIDMRVVERSPAALLTGDMPTGADASVLVVDRSGLEADLASILARTAAMDGLPILWIGAGDVPSTTEGAGGRLAPAADRATLVAAVRAVAAGLWVVDPKLPATAAARPVPSAGEDPLSPREHEVLALVAAGHPNKTIARTLGISEHTVKFHVSALLSKLNATSRTEAVTLATRRGLLSL